MTTHFGTERLEGVTDSRTARSKSSFTVNTEPREGILCLRRRNTSWGASLNDLRGEYRRSERTPGHHQGQESRREIPHPGQRPPTDGHPARIGVEARDSPDKILNSPATATRGVIDQMRSAMPLPEAR